MKRNKKIIVGILSLILIGMSNVYANATIEVLQYRADSYIYRWQLVLRDMCPYIVNATVIVVISLVLVLISYAIFNIKNRKEKL